MTSDTADIRCRWVTCCHKRDAEYVVYVEAYVAAAENARYVDYVETDDDECVLDDATFEALANAADERETDDGQCAFADAMESFGVAVDDVEGGAAENDAATVVLGDHDVAATNKILLLYKDSNLQIFCYFNHMLFDIYIYSRRVKHHFTNVFYTCI